jgi:uncharacterized Rossmann fold enzyme
MSIIDLLLDTAQEDNKLLMKYDELGDNFSKSRDVDFTFNTSDLVQAEVVKDFVNDNNYGTASLKEVDGRYRITVIINMPVTQNVISSISALMACISKVFKVDYDGWGSVISK